MMDLGLPARIRAKGVEVVLVPGWETRTAGSFDPWGALFHHTAGGPLPTSSLGVCTFGRGGPNPLPGPLCQVLQSREPGPGLDKAYMIAAGRANHAGAGVWRGVSGNSRFHGLEVEHFGTGPVAERRLETGARIIAAMLEGGSDNAANACQHFEYAQPPGRKIDFFSLSPWTPAKFRERVAFWIGRTVHDDDSTEDDDMPATYRLDLGDRVAFVLPDGTVCDVSFENSPATPTTPGKPLPILEGSLADAAMTAVYIKKAANAVHVDRAQACVARSTRARFG